MDCSVNAELLAVVRVELNGMTVLIECELIGFVVGDTCEDLVA